MYRSDVASDWQIDTGITIDVQVNNNDKAGIITINHLRKGEYALAIYQSDKVDSVLSAPLTDTCFVSSILNGIKDVKQQAGNFIVYPNPSQHNFTLEGTLPANGELSVYNINGQRMYHRSVNSGPVRELINTNGWGNGIFVLRVSDASQREVTTKKVVVIKEE